MFLTFIVTTNPDFDIIEDMKTKNNRTKFGLFSSESDAKAMCEIRSKEIRFTDSTFYTTKVARNKAGKNSWLAYCLTKKKK